MWQNMMLQHIEFLSTPPQNLAGTARPWSGGSSATASWPELKLKSWQDASLGCSSVAWFQKCINMKQKYKPKKNDGIQTVGKSKCWESVGLSGMKAADKPYMASVVKPMNRWKWTLLV